MKKNIIAFLISAVVIYFGFLLSKFIGSKFIGLFTETLTEDPLYRVMSVFLGFLIICFVAIIANFIRDKYL